MVCENYSPITFNCVPMCFVCSYHGKCKKEAAVSASNADSGKTEKGSTTNFSASNDTKSFGRFQDV